MSFAYTRATGKKVLVTRTLFGERGDSFGGLKAVPVSRVLREHNCDRCEREIERGELVLRERYDWGFASRCDLCADWILLEDLL